MEKIKFKITIIFTLLFLLLCSTVNNTALAEISPKIYLNGTELSINAKIEKNRLMIPLRNYFETLGAKVEWNKEDNSIKVTKENTIITMTIGKTFTYVNGVKKELDVPSHVVNGITYVPVRFFSESLGSNVQWDNIQKIVTVTSPITSYDVIVIGTDPEGVMAAVAAAREGQKTLLIDTRSRIGGLFTLGELNSFDMNYSPDGRLLTRGLYEEFFNKNDRRTSFDTDQAESVLNEMIKKESNISLELSATKIKPIVENNKIKEVSYTNSLGKPIIQKGKTFIDSTQNADFTYLTGEQFTFGQEDYRNTPETMSVTQVFELKNIDWNAIKTALKNDGNSNTGYDSYSAWGFLEMYNYVPRQSDLKMRGLNIGLQNDGSILINALQILNIDGTKESEILLAKQKAQAELPYIVKYMNENLKGFENAVLSRTASELYIRETRHLIGQYRLNVDDVLENRDFPDKIAFGSYPIDVQTSATQSGFVVGDPSQYSVPFRSIVPKKITNLLVASRSASYDSLAHGSARVVPVGMVVGEAAGIASAYSNKNNVDFITMAQQPNFEHVKQVQKIMNEKGANLADIPYYENPVMSDWSYEGIKLLRKYGLLSGSYSNNYGQSNQAKKRDVKQLMNGINERAKLNKLVTYPFESTLEDLTKDDIINFIEANGKVIDDLSIETQKHINESTIMTRDILYMVIYELIKGTTL